MTDKKAPTELTTEELDQSQGGLFGIGGWDVVEGVAGFVGGAVGGPAGAGLLSAGARHIERAEKDSRNRAGSKPVHGNHHGYDETNRIL
ncbi:MAG: hypothetical protein AAF409_12620 [Pseudomonadota bacterium]